MARVLIRIDRNGTKYFADDTCKRCGGIGERSEWYYTGLTCWECGGTGKVTPRIEKEYTPEYAAILDERRAEREAKKLGYSSAEAMRAARKAYAEQKEAERKAEEEAEEKRILAEEARIKAEKAVSQYVGEIGSKITVNCVYEYSASFQVRDMFGRPDTRYVHSFKDANGNKLIWKTGCCLGSIDLNCGDSVILTGTVKDHSEYKDEKQTSLLRCKIVRPTIN